MIEPMEGAFAPDRLAVLLKPFAELNDERESWRVADPLNEVLLLVTCATFASCDDFDDIVLWGGFASRFAMASRRLRRCAGFCGRSIRRRSSEPFRVGS